MFWNCLNAGVSWYKSIKTMTEQKQRIPMSSDVSDLSDIYVFISSEIIITCDFFSSFVNIMSKKLVIPEQAISFKE